VADVTLLYLDASDSVLDPPFNTFLSVVVATTEEESVIFMPTTTDKVVALAAEMVEISSTK